MDNKKLKGLLAIGAALGAAAAAGAVVSKRRKKGNNRKVTALPKGKNIYFLNNGYAALFGAVYLINECGFKGDAVHILGRFPTAGAGDADGFVCGDTSFISRENSSTLMSILANVPSGDIGDISIKTELENYNTAYPLSPTGRLFSPEEDYITLSADDKKRIIALLKAKEAPQMPLSEYFSTAFFASDFFDMINSMFAMDSTAQLASFKRLLEVVLEDASAPETCEGLTDTVYDHYEEIYLPMRKYLGENEVDFQDNTVITDIDFDDENENVRAIHVIEKNTVKTFYLNEGDMCFITPMTEWECAAQGTMSEPAPADKTEPAALWKALCRKHDGFGDAYALQENPVVRFTVTLSGDCLQSKIFETTLNSPGTLLTFKDSPWGMSVMCPLGKYFTQQPDDVYVFYGEILRPYVEGRYAEKTAAESGGEDILRELMGELGLENEWEAVKETVINAIPIMMPYGKAAPNAEREVLCPAAERGKGNIAAIGEFAAGSGIPGTLEYDASSAVSAVNALLGREKHAEKKKRSLFYTRKISKRLSEYM